MKTTINVFLVLSSLLFSFSAYGQWYTNGSTNVYTYDKAGVGTSTPSQELHVMKNGSNADIREQRIGESHCDFFSGTDSNGAGLWNYGNRPLRFATNARERLRITGSGNIGINTSNPQYALDVCGTVRAKEMRIESGWCDYVFQEDYNLPTLEEEAQHIETKGYLAGFESEAEMNGEIQLGDVTKRQQEKIEQMMLHIIALNEEVKALKAQIAKQ